MVEFLSLEFLVGLITKFMAAALLFEQGCKNADPPSEFKDKSVNLEN